MTYTIEAIGTVDPVSREILAGVGVTTTRDLLTLSGDADRRREISAHTGLTEDTLLRWIRIADLMRIGGIDESYAECLLRVGVRGVGELRGRRAAELAIELSRVNETLELVPVTPSVSTLDLWIRHAGLLREPACP